MRCELLWVYLETYTYESNAEHMNVVPNTWHWNMKCSWKCCSSSSSGNICDIVNVACAWMNIEVRLKPKRDSAPTVWHECWKVAIFVTSSRLRASFVRRCARNFSQVHNFDASTAFHRNHLRRFRRAFGDVRRRDYRRFMTRHQVRHEKHPKVL